MAKKGSTILIALVCTVCKSQNYLARKNKTTAEGKLSLKKYCKQCKKHTEHKETEKLK